MALQTVDFEPNNRIIQLAIQAAAGVEAPQADSAVFQFDDFSSDVGQADDSIIRFGKKKVTSRKNLRSGFSGSSRWKYSGTAGTPSIMSILFRMGGMNADTTDPAKVTYIEADSSTMDMATARSFDDISATESYLNKMVDSRGVLGFDFMAKETPKIKIAALGAYAEPSVASTFTADWGDQETNVGPDLEAINLENEAIQLAGKSLCLVSASTDNARRVKTGRAANTCETDTSLVFVDGTWTIVFRTPHLDNDWNPWTYYKSGELVPFKIGVGKLAGKRLSVEYAEVQLGKPTEGSDSEGQATLSIPLNIESELVITES